MSLILEAKFERWALRILDLFFQEHGHTLICYFEIFSVYYSGGTRGSRIAHSYCNLIRSVFSTLSNIYDRTFYKNT